MSTIYRYLDVLSVEKCIGNINDFIKIKRIFIIMSVIESYPLRLKIYTWKILDYSIIFCTFDVICTGL